MASSGQITLYIESVDYNGGGPYTRGAQYSNLVANWNVDDGGYLTLSETGYNTNEQNWWICSSVTTDINRYYVKWEVQFKPDGEGWQTLYSDKVAVKGPCASYDYRTGTNVKAMMETFCAGFPGTQLTKSGELRVICGANLAPAPDASYRYAFPNDVYSESSQVPVHIDVSWEARLKYDANGGSGAPADQTYNESGASHNFIVSSTIPVRRHHRFDGWSTNSSATTPSYHGGDTFTVNKGDPTKTLYAVWTKFYHPGAVLDGNSKWMSHDRSSGACQSLSNVAQSTWHDMRTIDAPTGLGDPPAIYRNSKWFNQKKIGKE